MRVNRGSTDGRSTDQGDGSGAMREPSGGGSEREGAGAGQPGSRTHRGNQNDEDVGSSAARGGGAGEANAPRRGASDLDPIPDTDLPEMNDSPGG